MEGRPTSKISWTFDPEDVLVDGNGDVVLLFEGQPSTWVPREVGARTV